MEKIVVSSQELLKRLNAELAARRVMTFTIATLGPRDGENPNWEINGHGGFGPNLMDNNEITISREVERQFANHEVDWSL